MFYAVEESIVKIWGRDWAIIYDMNEKRLFFNGNPVEREGTRYNAALLKGKNIGKEKRRLITVESGNHVIGIDKGYDGRIFIKEWSREDYVKFRRPPKKVASIWDKGRKVLLYVDDLTTPFKEIKRFAWETMFG